MSNIVEIVLPWVLFSIPSICVLVYIWKTDRLKVRTEYSKNVIFMFMGIYVSITLFTSMLPIIGLQLMYNNHWINTNTELVLNESIAPLESGRYFRWETEKQDTRVFYAVNLEGKGYTLRSTTVDNKITIKFVEGNFRVERFHVYPKESPMLKMLGVQNRRLGVSYIFYVPERPK